MKVAPWVERSESVPEALPIAQKLLMLSEEMESITATEWDTPSTRAEVRERMTGLNHLRDEINELWERITDE